MRPLQLGSAMVPFTNEEELLLMTRSEEAFLDFPSIKNNEELLLAYNLTNGRNAEDSYKNLIGLAVEVIQID
jgi:hypothetical protein